MNTALPHFALYSHLQFAELTSSVTIRKATNRTADSTGRAV
jgi:hypothetical protein